MKATTLARSSGTVWRAGRLAAVLAAAVLLMGGCLSGRYHDGYRDWKSFSHRDAVGSWCGQAGDLLTVAEDKGFVLTQMSAEFYEKLMESRNPSGRSATPRPTNPESARGKWEVREISKTWRLSLSIDKIGEEQFDFGTELTASKKDDRGFLLFYVSDPDFGFDYLFTKCDKPQPQRS